MDWSEFVEAATAISWITYLATADSDGLPHVAPVAPGFQEGTIWFVTRRSSKKARNLAVNPEVAFHWPVGGGTGPGELAARGRATVLGDAGDRARLWTAGVVPYDLSSFFGSPDDPDVVFVSTAVRRARLLGPDFRPRVWTPAG